MELNQFHFSCNLFFLVAFFSTSVYRFSVETDNNNGVFKVGARQKFLFNIGSNQIDLGQLAQRVDNQETGLDMVCTCVVD
jgi:hypothetical protein